MKQSYCIRFWKTDGSSLKSKVRGAGCWPTQKICKPSKNSDQSVQSCQSPCQPNYASQEPKASSAKTLSLPKMHRSFCRVSCALAHIQKGSPDELSFSIINKVYDNAAACAIN